MALQILVDNLDDVASQFHELYTAKEGGGGFELTGVDTKAADVQRLSVAISKEREATRLAKAALTPFVGIDLAEVEEFRSAKKQREAESAKTAGQDNSKAVQLEAANKLLADQLTAAQSLLTQFTDREKTRTVHDAVRAAAVALKVRDTAVEDVLMYATRTFELTDDGKILTRDDVVGVTPGITPDLWLAEITPKKPHWLIESKGGGAGGGGGGAPQSNPWDVTTRNLTEQGRILRTNPALAAQLMAKAQKK